MNDSFDNNPIPHIKMNFPNNNMNMNSSMNNNMNMNMNNKMNNLNMTMNSSMNMNSPMNMNYNMNMNNINYNPLLYNNNNFNNFNYMNPVMNMFPMNPMMNNNMNMNNNMSTEDQNIFRLKYLLNNIQQNLYYVMNDINEIETILNNMRNEGLDNSPNFLLLNNQFNLMQNNFFNNNMMNMNLNKKIKVTFRKSGFGSSGISLEIECGKNEKVKDVIKRYREISGLKEENVKFIFNAKALKLESTLEEAGIRDKSIIFVVLYH